MFNLPAGFLTSFLRSQLLTTLPYPTYSFTGQTILITGSNIGLGLEAARHFARLNASRIILGCRSHKKGLAAREDILATTRRNEDCIEVWEVDLADFESVRAFCKRAEGLERLDVVVENAGVATPEYELIEGEWERTIGVNVIATFLMALLLIPVLKRNGEKWDMVPQLVIVASDAHEQAVFKEQSSPNIFSALNSGGQKNQPDKYNISKLLEILVVRELGPLLLAKSPSPSPSKSQSQSQPQPTIVLNTLTPGFCHSSLMRSARFPLSFFAYIGKLLLARSTEVGSRTLLAAACAGPESHGKYMADCKVREPSAWVRSEKGVETGKRVWSELSGILERIEPGILGTLEKGK